MMHHQIFNTILKRIRSFSICSDHPKTINFEPATKVISASGFKIQSLITVLNPITEHPILYLKSRSKIDLEI